MIVGPAGAEVRTGESHEGEPGTVGAAPDRDDLWFYAQFAENAAGIFHQVSVGYQNFFHVVIGVFHLHGDSALAVLLVKQISAF